MRLYACAAAPSFETRRLRDAPQDEGGGPEEDKVRIKR
jgi:hypothetical protein